MSEIHQMEMVYSKLICILLAFLVPRASCTKTAAIQHIADCHEAKHKSERQWRLHCFAGHLRAEWGSRHSAQSISDDNNVSLLAGYNSQSIHSTSAPYQITEFLQEIRHR